MGHRRLVRLQIGLLVLVTLLVIGRSMWTARVSAERAVVLDSLAADELAEQGFELSAETVIRVEAVGSVAKRDSDTTLAAYAWIIDADSGEPAWVMRLADATARRGTLVEVDTTITLAAGRYHAYFASFGQTIGGTRRSGFITRLFREQDHWVNDARRWRLELRPESGAEAFGRRDAPLTSDSLVVYATGPMTSRQRAEEVLDVRSSVEIVVRSVGELTSAGDRRDSGWIVNLETADTVWTSNSASIWAGGAPENRLAESALRLEPGLYAAGYSTDNRHAWEDWRANPPFDPRAWGLRISLNHPADASSVNRFDPRLGREPLIDLTGIGSDEEVGVHFRIQDTLRVVVEALGEISRSRYDYGWIETVAGERIWEMTAERSSHAGGHSSNRREIAFLTLPPDAYFLRYQTDGSHAFDAWRHDPPENPERWGIAMWTRNAADSARVEFPPEDPLEHAEQAVEVDTVETTLVHGEQTGTGEILVDLSGLGNEQDVSETFELDSTRDVFVRAVGEITLNSRFDYGWIENAATGARIWEMTYDNTVAAGGAGRNRLYEGVLKLPAGRYRVNFQTDFSHAYGDFPPGEAPTDSAAWGVQVRLFE